MTRAAAQGAEAVMIYGAIESGDLRRDECIVSFIEINVLGQRRLRRKYIDNRSIHDG
jgi:hypothetical protein